jgi:LacI family transcriptional regulator
MGQRHPNQLNVRIDDFAAAREMTGHLIALGHRRIGFIRGDDRQIASRERERGFLNAIAENDIHPNSIMIEQGDFTFQGGLKAGAILLGQRHRPTAIFASNDDMAAGVVSLAHQQGLSIPDDLSVAGFDDTGVATLTWPPLTTVRQPVSRMADVALQLILRTIERRRLNEDQLEEDRVLPHQLILRESTGPVTQSKTDISLVESRGRRAS